MKEKKRAKLNFTKEELNSIIESVLETETIVKIIENNYYQTQMIKANNIDVDINHLENIFTNETYYSAMKIVPLLERKVLYLSYVENVRLSDIW